MNNDRDQDVINPLDFFDLDGENSQKQDAPKGAKSKSRPMSGGAVFVTGTDTGVGKTVATHVLALLLRNKRCDVGVMKPVQCGGHDAQSLRRALTLKDPLADINPYHAKEALSPHIAFKRQQIHFEPGRVAEHFARIKARHGFTLVEGAGGLLVPITDEYLMLDLIRDLGLGVVVVARLGLGTINHTLLTIRTAQENGLAVRGIIFNEFGADGSGIPEKTNPEIIQQMSRVPVLGILPHFKKMNNHNLLQQARGRIDVQPLLEAPASPPTVKWPAWDKKYVWHPFTQMKDWVREQPLVIDKAQGSYLEDISGKRYLDGISSLWVNVHGHRKKPIDLALKQQINKVAHSTLLGAANTPSIQLAHKLIGIAPRGLRRVFYSDNGSTAVEIAIKMAYQYWQNIGRTKKTKIAHLEHAYHGDTLGAVSVGGIDQFHKIFHHLTFKTLGIEFPDFYRAPDKKAYPQYIQECLDKMEALFRSNGQEVAALVVEPLVQAAAGMIVWPTGILKSIKVLCEKYKILLIADEVATGFGRTGRMFACEHEKITPDFLCLAKGLSGGYLPLAATLTTERIYKGFLFPHKAQRTFFHGHTYTGNPLCCAAALANLTIFDREKTIDKLQPKIRYLHSRLKQFNDLPHVGQVRQKGLMVGIELVRNKETQAPYPWEERIGIRVCQAIRKKGVLLRPLGNVIVLMPPLSISKNEMNILLDAAYWGIKSVTEKSLPRERK